MGYSKENKAPAESGGGSLRGSIWTGVLLLIAVCLFLAVLDSVTGTDSFLDTWIRPWFLQ